jgi:hypothetical protein
MAIKKKPFIIPAPPPAIFFMITFMALGWMIFRLAGLR